MVMSKLIRVLGAAAAILVSGSVPRAFAAELSLPQVVEQAGELNSSFHADHDRNQVLLELYRAMWRLQEERGNLRVELLTSTRSLSDSYVMLRGIARTYPEQLRFTAWNPANMNDEQILQVLREWTSDIHAAFFRNNAGLNAERNIWSMSQRIATLRDRIAQLDQRIDEVQRAIDRLSPPNSKAR